MLKHYVRKVKYTYYTINRKLVDYEYVLFSTSSTKDLTKKTYYKNLMNQAQYFVVNPNLIHPLNIKYTLKLHYPEYFV